MKRNLVIVLIISVIAILVNRKTKTAFEETIYLNISSETYKNDKLKLNFTDISSNEMDTLEDITLEITKTDKL